MPKRILIVDDSVAIRTVVATDLKQRGYEIDDAAGGRSALDKARNLQYDMVVTDLNMPGLDGLGLVKALRQLAGYAQTPIMVLTTETSDEMKATLREAGASGWMSKPYTSERMTAALTRMLPGSA